MSANPFETKVSTKHLRECQAKAYEAVSKHYSEPGAERVTLIQLPTGAGKSGLLAITPFGLGVKRVLILTPNLKLAKDMAEGLDIIENPDENAYTRFKILSDSDISTIELFVLKLQSSASAKDIGRSHLIVANYQQLQDIEKWFADKKDAIDLIIIDEAHHQAATTYQEILDFFPDAKVVGLTATPFRSDGKPIEGEVIYKYSFAQAIKAKIIRNLHSFNVAPEEIELKFEDEERRKYSLSDVLKLNEESWFRRGIAVSQDCSDSIARLARDKWLELKKRYPNESHQIIAAAMSKHHARHVVKVAFEKLGLNVGMVSSDKADLANNDPTHKKLKQGKLDVIIHVGMLGEGFDHPPLGVAAIFRPYVTLNPYIQFIGRVIRANGAARFSYIVSHMGLNQLKRFTEFRLFDQDDQETLEMLLNGGTEGSKTDSTFTDEGESERTAPTPPPEITEIGDGVVHFDSRFVIDDELQNLASTFNEMTPERKAAFLALTGLSGDSVSIASGKSSKRVKPASERLALQKQLSAKAQSITGVILRTLGVDGKGRDFNIMYDNYPWIVQFINRRINKAVGIGKGKRKDIDNPVYAEIEASGVLVKIAQDALEHFREKLEEKS